MSTDTEKPNRSAMVGPGLQQMLQLLENEIARLQEELAALRSSDHPQRRALVQDRVARIDERQMTLDSLKASMEQESPAGGTSF